MTKIERMRVTQRESNHYVRKEVLPRKENRVEPFDVETTFAEAALKRKNERKKYHGPDAQLYSAIYPLVCIMKVFGLAPYDFTGDHLAPSNACLVFSFAFMAIYSYIMHIVFMRFIAMKRQKPVLTVVETTKVIVNFLVAMYELVSTMYNRRMFVQIWNALQDFDEKLSKLGYPRKELKTHIAVWFLLISQTIVWVTVNQSGMYAFMETWLFNVGYMWTYVGTSISVYKFYGMVSFIGQRFRQLNDIARENMPARFGYKSSCVSRKTIQDLHNELMSSAEALNSIYSWSLLFWLGNLSVHSVSNLYFIIDWMFLSPWSNIPWPLIFNMSCWLVGFVAQLLVIHIGCDGAITEANSMGAILIEWDARVIKRFPHDDTIRTSLHFLNRRLRFSAGGLFDVNLPLLCSIVGVLSTYLIILLQFPA